jgi:branched-chain amino acid transport system ATP-binding protein
MSDSLLELRNVSSFYGKVQALRDVSLRVEQGEVVTLLGANGSGKSTTLRTISGLVRAARGEIIFHGKPIHQASCESIVRGGIAHVPEGRRIFPGLTVTDNLMLGASNRKRLAREAMKVEIGQMFDIFPDLGRLAGVLGWTLSGGQQQMLAVARGLMARPELLLLDEPSLGLAPLIVQQLFGMIREIHARGTTIVLVEQNAHMALTTASRGYVLETGMVVVEGSAAELLDNEAVSAAYLGGGQQAEAR